MNLTRAETGSLEKKGNVHLEPNGLMEAVHPRLVHASANHPVQPS